VNGIAIVNGIRDAVEDPVNGTVERSALAIDLHLSPRNA
jgi:hypothetical protein